MGVTYDTEHNLLYLVQPDADTVTNEFEPYPLIHVFRLVAALQTGDPSAVYLPAIQR